MDAGQILLINKPFRWTSFDVVRKVKGALFQQMKTKGSSESERKHFKVGHAGTLDPLATGLLIICTGSLTKKIQEIQDAEKEYTGSFCLGGITDSYDLETVVRDEKEVLVTREEILEAARTFTGKQMQTPPAHSAVKVNGKRAYALARKGKEVAIKPKEVDIQEFEITGIRLPYVDFRIVCSKGTYIRSLAHDLGKTLHCGAHLASLCRTRIGRYHLEQALDMQAFTSQTHDFQSI